MANYGFTINCDGNSIAQMELIKKQLAEMGVKANVEVKKVESRFREMGEKVKGTFGDLKSIIAGGFIAGGVWGGIEFIKSATEAWDKYEKVVARVNQVVTSTNGAAGFSAKSIEDQAKELSKGILNSRSEIMDAQGMLLSFTGIRGPIFEETTKAVADFATFYKTDMTSAALSIGKAMNDPLHGMTKLQKQGVTFTEEQKKQVEMYMKQNRLAEAQKVILQELNKEFGGQAKALAATAPDEMAKKSWGQMKIDIGEVLDKVQDDLVPTFLKLVDVFKAVFNSAPVQYFLHHFGDLVALVVRVLPYWLAYKTAMFTIHQVEKLRSMELSKLVTYVKNFSFASKEAALAQEGLAAAEGEAAVAAGGLKIALMETGVMALVVGIGMLIEKLSAMNAEFDASIDKITNLKKITGKGEELSGANNDVNLALQNFGNLPQNLQVETYRKAKQVMEDAQNANLTENTSSIANTKKRIAEATKLWNASAHKETVTTVSGGMASTSTQIVKDSKLEREIAALKDQLKTAEKVTDNNSRIVAQKKADIEIMDKYFKAHKIDPNKVYEALSEGSADAVKKSSISTSNLSGAQGGLGQARVINIHIDTMQKVVTADNKDLKKKGQDAIEVMVRTLNNLAYNQAGAM